MGNKRIYCNKCKQLIAFGRTLGNEDGLGWVEECQSCRDIRESREIDDRKAHQDDLADRGVVDESDLY